MLKFFVINIFNDCFFPANNILLDISELLLLLLFVQENNLFC